MFDQITMIDFERPLRKRLESRKYGGPYTWSPAKPMTGRGFYQTMVGLKIDKAGSTFKLRLVYANQLLTGFSRLRQINGYYCDLYGEETLTPIVARLPRSRGFLAGWTMGGGMRANLGAHIWPDEHEAALAAHDMAERDAEHEREMARKHEEIMENEADGFSDD